MRLRRNKPPHLQEHLVKQIGMRPNQAKQGKNQDQGRQQGHHPMIGHFGGEPAVVVLIQSLPNLHDSDSQRAFLSSAGIDAKAQDQIPVGKPPAQFAPLLVSTLAKYGTLHDGRHALEAVLEAAKQFVGQEKSVQCDELIQQVQTYFTRNT